ncbi:hypothetical protein FRC04_001093 [Tulasnella sp. 424]|nr:hypothetical protein FRC04_001093 [Tulasnella sp. 424]
MAVVRRAQPVCVDISTRNIDEASGTSANAGDNSSTPQVVRAVERVTQSPSDVQHTGVLTSSSSTYLLLPRKPKPVPHPTRRSSRKDSVKQHMRRRHQDSRGLQVITLPANAQPQHHGHPHHHHHHHHHPHGHHHPPRSRQSSNSSLEFDPSPPPDLMPGTAATTTTILPPPPPPLDATPFQAPLYYAEPSPESWPPPLLAQ